MRVWKQTTTIHSFGHAGGNAQGGIVALVSPLRPAVTQHAGLVAEQTPDGGWGQVPECGQVPHAIVVLGEGDGLRHRGFDLSMDGELAEVD